MTTEDLAKELAIEQEHDPSLSCWLCRCHRCALALATIWRERPDSLPEPVGRMCAVALGLAAVNEAERSDKALRAILALCGRPAGPDAEIGGSVAAVAQLAAERDAATLAERERCCKLTCLLCSQNHPVARHAEWGWYHPDAMTLPSGAMCRAHYLRRAFS